MSCGCDKNYSVITWHLAQDIYLTYPGSVQLRQWTFVRWFLWQYFRKGWESFFVYKNKKAAKTLMETILDLNHLSRQLQPTISPLDFGTVPVSHLGHMVFFHFCPARLFRTSVSGDKLQVVDRLNVSSVTRARARCERKKGIGEIKSVKWNCWLICFISSAKLWL